MKKHKMIFITVPYFNDTKKDFFTYKELDSLTDDGWLIIETKDLLMSASTAGKVFQILLEKKEKYEPKKDYVNKRREKEKY